MPDSEFAQWLQSRGFYALLILVLLAVGLVLALARRRRNPPQPPRKPASPFGRARRGRSR